MKVLLATDGSEYSKTAVEKCCRMFAESENTEIRILSAAESAIPPMEPFDVSNDHYREVNDAEREQAGEVVSDTEAQIRKCFPGLAVDLTTKVAAGSAEQSIVEEAESWGADLIMLGSHGYAFWQRALLGSVSDAVTHHAPCPVLVVPTPEKSQQKDR